MSQPEQAPPGAPADMDVDRAHIVHDGFMYSVLPEGDPDGAGQLHDGGSFYPMPAGWELAPAEADILSRVVAPRGWSTSLLHLGGRSSVFATKNNGAAGMESHAVPFEQRPSRAARSTGREYRPYDRYCRFLIRKRCRGMPGAEEQLQAERRRSDDRARQLEQQQAELQRLAQEVGENRDRTRQLEADRQRLVQEVGENEDRTRQLEEQVEGLQAERQQLALEAGEKEDRTRQLEVGKGHDRARRLGAASAELRMLRQMLSMEQQEKQALQAKLDGMQVGMANLEDRLSSTSKRHLLARQDAEREAAVNEPVHAQPADQSSERPCADPPLEGCQSSRQLQVAALGVTGILSIDALLSDTVLDVKNRVSQALTKSFGRAVPPEHMRLHVECHPNDCWLGFGQWQLAREHILQDSLPDDLQDSMRFFGEGYDHVHPVKLVMDYPIEFHVTGQFGAVDFCRPMRARSMQRIREVLRSLASAYNLDPSTLILEKDASRIYGWHFLVDCDIDGAYLTVRPCSDPTVEISVQPLTGPTMSLHMSLGDAVGSMKEKIADTMGIPFSRQHLRFEGNALQDDMALSQYGIRPQSIVFLADR